ncbi:MAG: hypothetical protein DI535_13010 [Citrobacter freundii]|nr:MAG: hypothetical protein DI535_13010 [Citrobacter freundii]
METPVILFEEVQRSGRMKHKWFYGIIAIIFAIALGFDYISSRPSLAFTAFLWSGLVIFIFLQVFSLYGFEMITQIREDGIYVRFTPYQPSFERFVWEDIEEIHVRKFNPFKEYGYGVRMNENGKGYTIPGDTGIYLVRRNQMPVMISTKCAEQIIETLKKMGRIK